MKRIILLLSVFLFGCETSDKPQLSLTSEQAVYESVALMYIKSMAKDVKILNKTNVVWFQKNALNELINRTTWREHNDVFKFKAPTALLESLYNNNQVAENINWEPLIVNGTLVPVETHAPSKKAQEPVIYSYYSFSRVVFTENRKEALVKFTHHCPALCGGEWIIYLNFRENQWKVTEALTLWVS